MIEVSAILVAKIHFRVSDGVVEKILACCPGGRAAYIGHMNTYEMGVRRGKGRFTLSNLHSFGLAVICSRIV